MDLWRKGLKPLLVPGGVLFFASVALLQSGIVPIPVSAIHLCYYVVFGAGILLAWRFHSSRVLWALVTLLLAQQAVEFFSGGRAGYTVQGRTALEIVAFLLPLNFVWLSLTRERGLAISAFPGRLGILFIESVFVAVACRPGATSVPAFLHPPLLDLRLLHASKIPPLGWLVFAVVWATLLFRIVRYRKPVESGLLWSLTAVFLSLRTGGLGGTSVAYTAVAGLILGSSIIENSYILAYHDELTGLPARRSFNEAVLQLKDTYSVAVVDIDHFKAFNDTYGHETGDQVLRMVAAKLARVSGGGRAFRVGGEEFCILFPGESLQDALPHLELLRTDIEACAFRVRSPEERRRAPQPSADRRKAVRRKTNRPQGIPPRSFSKELSLTVSIGVAEPAGRMREVERVMHAADQALYRAKRGGRNRVEVAPLSRPRLKRSIA